MDGGRLDSLPTVGEAAPTNDHLLPKMELDFEIPAAVVVEIEAGTVSDPARRWIGSEAAGSHVADATPALDRPGGSYQIGVVDILNSTNTR